MSKNNYIHFGKPFIGEEDIAEVVDTLKSGWLTTGPKTEQFEKEFAEYIGCKYAVAVSSCTAGLFLSQLAYGIGPGDKVITTPLTFVATPNSIRHTGATPLFVDVNPNTGLIEPDTVEELISNTIQKSIPEFRKIKAIMPVHLWGQPVDMDGFKKLADKYNLLLIDDAAHAIEAETNQGKIGSLGNVTCFSFYSSKNICTGEGGMITTNNKDIADKIKIMRLHGLNKDAWRRSSSNTYQHYLAEELGYKFNMIDLHSALGIHQLKRVKERQNIREEQWNNYMDNLNIPEIKLPIVMPGTKHAYHLFTIRVDNRDELINKLHERGIGCGVHYPSISEQPIYKNNMNILTPNADKIGREILSLPLGGALTESQQSRIIEEIKDIYNV